MTGPRGSKEAEEKADAKMQQELADQIALQSKATAAKLKSPDRKKGEKITFRSIWRGFRLQITSPEDEIIPGTNKVKHARPKVAQFRNYVFHTNDEEIIEGILNYAQFGKVVFDSRDLDKASLKKDANRIIERMENDPELKSALIQHLEGAAFPMPGSKSQSNPQSTGNK